MTWLNEYPKLFERCQPLETANARRRRREAEARNKERNNSGNSQKDTINRDDDSCNSHGEGVADEEAAADEESNNDRADSASSTGSDSEFRFKFVSLDGKVFPFEGFRGSHALNRACFSSKTQTSGLQTLVWSMPCGTPILVTGLFAAKLSEKRQVQIHSKWLEALPMDVRVLQDRGFRKLQRYYTK